jgi:hypothetical protein
MKRKLGFGAVAALMAFGQVSAAYADSGAGIAANRTALGLPTQARVGSCVYGAGCSDGSNQLAGGVAIVPLIAALGVVAGAATLVATRHNNHDHNYGYAPVSP